MRAGSGRVTFQSNRSYRNAIRAGFVRVNQHNKFEKEIQIEPYLSENAKCSRCTHPGYNFCSHDVS